MPEYKCNCVTFASSLNGINTYKEVGSSVCYDMLPFPPSLEFGHGYYEDVIIDSDLYKVKNISTNFRCVDDYLTNKDVLEFIGTADVSYLKSIFTDNTDYILGIKKYKLPVTNEIVEVSLVNAITVHVSYKPDSIVLTHIKNKF